jgi:hypothetical protein
LALLRKYSLSRLLPAVGVTPLTVRQVRDAPSLAFQSALPTTIAELSWAVVSASDGAPDETFVFALLPTPSEPRYWYTVMPYFRPPVEVTDTSNVAELSAVAVQT